MPSTNFAVGPPEGCDRLYTEGSRLAELIAQRTSRGEVRRASLRIVAVALGLNVAEACRAVRFQEAVDHIAGNVGEGAREAILAGGRHLSPELVMRISRTHPDRQRFALAQVLQGRHPFAKPPAGVAPPFDTLGYGEVVSRIARTAGALDRVAVGLATPAGDWPGVETLQAIAARTAAVREAGSSLRVLMVAHRNHVGLAPVRAGRRRGRQAAAPAPFRPDRAYAAVSAARGVITKTLRDLPRLLREVPPTGGECAEALAGLGRLDAAAKRLSGVVRRHALVPPNPVPPGRAARRGRAAAAVPVVDCPDGPADWPGTYILVLRVDAAVSVTVRSGRTYHLPRGDHCYVGSAFNDNGGVRTRTRWHLTPVKATPRWRVDFLTPHARVVGLWWSFDPTKRECTWSAVLESSPGFGQPAPGFGAADCRSIRKSGIGRADGRICKAHLHHSLGQPDVQEFARRLDLLVPGHAPVYHQSLAPAGEADAVNNFPQAVAESPGCRRSSTSGAPPRPSSAPEAGRP